MFVFHFQKDSDRNHRVRIAIGNGLRADVWREFIRRFGDIRICEFYAATEGNIGFFNYTGKVGAVGRVNYFHKVRKVTSMLVLCPSGVKFSSLPRAHTGPLHILSPKRQMSSQCSAEFWADVPREEILTLPNFSLHLSYARHHHNCPHLMKSMSASQ